METPGRPFCPRPLLAVPHALQSQILPQSPQLPPVPTLPRSLPSLLHVGQQLAQQQGWGLHIHAQDLKSEQVEDGDRHGQPRPIFISPQSPYNLCSKPRCVQIGDTNRVSDLGVSDF